MDYIVKISEEDRDEIERLHYSVEARASLINRLATNAVKPNNADEALALYLQEYTKFYADYEKEKTYLENKYKPEEIKDTAKSWTVDFDTCEMTFDVDCHA